MGPLLALGLLIGIFLGVPAIFGLLGYISTHKKG